LISETIHKKSMDGFHILAFFVLRASEREREKESKIIFVVVKLIDPRSAWTANDVGQFSHRV